MAEGVDPQLQAIIDKIVAESGGRVTVSSSFRTRAQQEALYAKYKAGKGNLAARPGTSKHEHGLAVDFGGDLKLAKELAEKYGLVNSVPGEPWHFTLGGEGGSYAGDDADIYDRADNVGNPQDVLANRLHSVLRIIGQTPGSEVGSPSYEDDIMDQEFMPGDIDGDAAAQMAGSEYTSAGLAGAASGAKTALHKYAAKKMGEYGLPVSDLPALIKLWNKESGWDPNAQNPTSTAFGIAQFLNGTWKGVGMAKTTDPYKQIDAGLQYIKQRYGTPGKALQFHLANNWY